MSIRIGYLLPTRERIMAGQPQAAPLLELAERAERLGFDSVWAGDSLLARPRHEPLTLLAAVASRVRRVDIGTAVLLPALRNPVLLAHQVATLDQVAEDLSLCWHCSGWPRASPKIAEDVIWDKSRARGVHVPVAIALL